MLGMIPRCLQEMVISHYGRQKWQQVSARAGLNGQNYLPTEEVHDAFIHRLFDSAGKVLALNFEQVCDLFGEYWVNVYAPKMYHMYFERSQTARDFLMQLNAMHLTTTADVKNANPPSFEYEWLDENILMVEYQSHRSLIVLAAGLIRGVGKHFNEHIEVSIEEPNFLKICFP